MTMNIKDNWDRLDPATQKWLIENPGCQILPRTITSIISKETGTAPATGRHGEMALSQEDHNFIRSKASRMLST